MLLHISIHCSAHIEYHQISFYHIFALHNIPFGFKIFSVTDLYQFLIDIKVRIYFTTLVLILSLFIERSILSSGVLIELNCTIWI